jgi:hypothetical protein
MGELGQKIFSKGVTQIIPQIKTPPRNLLKSQIKAPPVYR